MPEDYLMALMVSRNGGLPLDGGLLVQPLRWMTVGPYLLDYARAFATFERDGQDAPDDVKVWVQTVAIESVQP